MPPTSDLSSKQFGDQKHKLLSLSKLSKQHFCPRRKHIAEQCITDNDGFPCDLLSRRLSRNIYSSPLIELQCTADAKSHKSKIRFTTIEHDNATKCV